MLETTYRAISTGATLPSVAANRNDVGLTDESRQLPHRMAFVCFAGDAVVVLACLLAAFWLRFGTGLRQFGVEAPRITLANYYSYIICGVVSLLLLMSQKHLYLRNCLLDLHSTLNHVSPAF